MKHLLIGVGIVVILSAVVLCVMFINYKNALSPPDVADYKNMKLSVTSSAFKHNAVIPAKYTCDGGNTNPPLSISGIPEGTVSLALVMDDPDVPTAVKADGMFDHWVVYSIPVEPGQTSLEIPEASVPGLQGLNGRAQEAYTGPCPPPQYEPTEHRYFFKVYALSTELTFLVPPFKADVEAAMNGYVIADAELIGLYDRKK